MNVVVGDVVRDDLSFLELTYLLADFSYFLLLCFIHTCELGYRDINDVWGVQIRIHLNFCQMGLCGRMVKSSVLIIQS